MHHQVKVFLIYCHTQHNVVILTIFHIPMRISTVIRLFNIPPPPPLHPPKYFTCLLECVISGYYHSLSQVDGEEVRCSSLPVHPLFLSVPMVQQPDLVCQSGQGDYTVRVVDGAGDYGDSDDDVVLTNNISVGLPSEGSVSSLLMPR